MRQLPTRDDFATPAGEWARRRADMRRMLRGLQLASVAGLAYSGVQLAAQAAPGDNWLMCVVAVWFVIALASVETILNRLIAGVWMLAATTALVVMVTLLSGVAAPVGLLLGALVAVLLGVYVLPLRAEFE